MDFSRKLQYFLNTLIPDIFENEDCGDCKGLTWYRQSLPFPSLSKNQKEAYRVRLSQPSFDCRSFTGYIKIKLSLLRSIQEFLFASCPPFSGGGYSLIWPIRGCAAGQGMAFLPLYPKKGI